MDGRDKPTAVRLLARLPISSWPGEVPAIHVGVQVRERCAIESRSEGARRRVTATATWMAGTSPGHDEMGVVRPAFPGGHQRIERHPGLPRIAGGVAAGD